MRLIVARCEVRYTGRLTATLPEALRLLMIKSDGSVMVHADTGGFKPQNWMTPPTVIEETPERIVVRKRAGATEDRLDIEIAEVVSDVTHDMGEAAALEKEGVERELQELLAAKRDLDLPRALRRLDLYDAVILDDIGYVQQSPDEIEVLFTFLAERYERRSVLITSNLVFSEWDRIFKNPMTTAAVIDRLVHHSVILEFAVPSFRSEKAAGNKAAEAKGDQPKTAPTTTPKRADNYPKATKGKTK